MEIVYMLDVETDLSNRSKPSADSATIPEPDTFEIAFVQGGKLFLVPIKVRYKLNPNFKETWLTNGSPIEDFAERADLVAVGIARSRDNWHLDNDYGNGFITVGSWLKGSGPADIEVASFDHATSCYFGLRMNEPLIFFLNQEEDGEYRLINLDTTGQFVSPKRYTAEDANKVLAATGSDAVETGVDIFAMEADSTGVFGTSLRPIMRPLTTGVLAILVLAASTFLWRRRRQGTG